MDPTKHVINLAHGGLLDESGQVSSSPAQLAIVLAALRDSGRQSLTLHFHGGLVPEADGLELARRLHERIMNETATYPVFVVWRTGAGDALGAILRRLQGTPLFAKLAEKLVAFVRRKLHVPHGDAAFAVGAAGLAADHAFDPAEAAALDDLLDAATPSPVTQDEEERIGRETEADHVVRRTMDHAAATLARTRILGAEAAVMGFPTRYVPSEETAFLDEGVVREWGAATAAAAGFAASAAGVTPLAGLGWRVARTFVRVVARLIDGSHHGAWPTIVEELLRSFYLAAIGAAGWEVMKADAAGAYAPGTPGRPLPGGTCFLDLLAADLQAHGPIGLNLVGHSAGAIHIGHLLAARQRAAGRLKFDKLALFAPACSFALFAETVVPAAADIGALEVFNLTDAAERTDPLIHDAVARHLYPRSLLYLVSGVLEGGAKEADVPLVGMQRFHVEPRYAGIPAVAATKRLLAERGAGAVVSCPGDIAKFALHAGDFEDRHGPNTDPSTLKALMTFLGGT